MTKLEKQVYELILEPIKNMNYELYDVMFLKEAGDNYLRVFIKREDGSKVDLDDCEKVSNTIDPILDEADPIEPSYNLEVSSCGLEPHLREESHFMNAIGQKIKITLYKSVEGSKEYDGILEKYDSSELQLDTGNKKMIFNTKDLASAKIFYDWEELKNE